MNSKFQILLTTAALAIAGVSIASLYGDDGSLPAATPVPAALPATPALAPAATALPAPGAAPVAAVEAPTIMPDRPVPLPNKAPKTAAPRPNSPMLPPATFTDKNDDDDVRIFSLVNAQAAIMAEQLRQLVPGVAIVSDERTNSILIRGPKQEAVIVEGLVRKLDETPNVAEPARRNPGGAAYGAGGVMPVPGGMQPKSQTNPPVPGNAQVGVKPGNNFGGGGGGFGGGSQSGGGGGFGAFGGNFGGGGGGGSTRRLCRRRVRRSIRQRRRHE